MAMKERPEVKTLDDGSKYWEHEYESFFLKTYVPVNDLDGQVNNYGFKAPLLLVFEEKSQTAEEAVSFARKTGLEEIAASYDASVLFVYPTCEGGWKNTGAGLYADVIAEVRMDTEYSDGIDSWNDFFAREFKGYFIRGAKFRADIYSYGESADYVAKNLLKTQQGIFLWGPGEITPAVCSMEGLSVTPDVQRKDIAVISVGNSDEINKAFEGCEHLLVKDFADYRDDFLSFVRRYKMWCGVQQEEAIFEEIGMIAEPGSVSVKTSSNNFGKYKDQSEHTVGYFAYYNEGIFDKGAVPLLVGCHGGGDSSMYLTYVSGFWQVAHDHDILYVALEDHLNITPTEIIDVIEHLKGKYSIDEKRIYIGGFSMGSGKTQDMFQEYPEYFAGLCPCSALFPVKDNMFSHPLGEINNSVPVPLFYSGGEKSPLPELPSQADSCLDRFKYLAAVNGLKKLKEIEALKFDEKDSWADPFWGVPGDRTEKLYDESRDSYLTVNYYDSEDGVCRTAFASVSGQQHECRHHSIETAWDFVSKFSR
ncbi:MAG: hypothetical protein K5871_10515 [Lachnospiraceae bacterium]|nr:hypothetical protein [Lachnospiraceae bacterium]